MSDLLHRVQHDADVFLERNPERCCCPLDLLAVHRGSELLRLPLLLDAGHFHVEDALGRADQCHCDQKPGQFVDRDQRLLEEGLRFDPSDLARVRQDRSDDLFRVTALSQDARADDRVPLRTDVRVPLVVEIMQDPDQPPKFLIFTEPSGVCPHGRFHRPHVTQKMGL